MAALTQLIGVQRYVEPLNPQTAPSKQRGQRMVITADNGSGEPIYFPYAPNEVDYDDLGGNWSELARPGYDDLLIPTNSPVMKISFRVILNDRARNLLRSTSWTLKRLQEIARSRQRIRVTYASFESGLWYLTGFKFSSEDRHPATDEIIQASANLELTKASDIMDGVGPVTGGVKPPSAPPQQAPPPQQSGARTYTVKSGDTLWDISIRYYGTGTKWKIIGDANGVLDPRKLQIGKVLRIP